jgi:hypothetical protein
MLQLSSDKSKTVSKTRQFHGKHHDNLKTKPSLIYKIARQKQILKNGSKNIIEQM